jgi:hypothetical protein
MTDGAALAYLEASGATAISIVEGESGCVFRTNARAAEVSAGVSVPATVWVSAEVATVAGDSPDLATAANALALAAAQCRVKLTPNDVAISRAQGAARQLDAYLASRGVLREFNRAFKQRRTAATMRGEGFMSYRAAESRLRKALVPMLVNGGTIGRSLFEQIFGR